MDKILLIDDDNLLRSQIREGLVKAGHDVIDVQSGEEGLKAYYSFTPDLVVTDIFMDNGDGIETIIALRKLNSDIPIITISGNILYLKQSIGFGATGMLEKPFRMAELLEMINQVQQTT